MSEDDARLLRLVRRGLRDPFADPIKVGILSMSRATGRMIERNLSCSSVGVSAR